MQTIVVSCGATAVEALSHVWIQRSKIGGSNGGPIGEAETAFPPRRASERPPGAKE